MCKHRDMVRQWYAQPWSYSSQVLALGGFGEGDATTTLAIDVMSLMFLAHASWGC